jgi:hypothetical protein
VVLLLPAGVDADPAARRAACLTALREGRSYLAQGAIALEECTATSADGRQASPGECLEAAGPITITVALRVAARVQWVQVIKDGQIVYDGADASLQWTDPGGAGMHYYRIAAKTEGGDFLLTNPIFFCSTLTEPKEGY